MPAVFDKLVKNPTDAGLIKADGTEKLSYVPFQTPSSMASTDYMDQPRTSNWTTDKNFQSIPLSFLILFHFSIWYCMLALSETFMGSLVKLMYSFLLLPKHMLEKNKVFFAHNKLVGCRLKYATAPGLNEWIKTLCDQFSWDDTSWLHQGNGEGDLKDAWKKLPVFKRLVKQRLPRNAKKQIYLAAYLAVCLVNLVDTFNLLFLMKMMGSLSQ